jgi:hypothetical protein
MPSASLNASAIAIVITPSITVIFELVQISGPIIIPSVVITPDTSPKLSPFSFDSSII